MRCSKRVSESTRWPSAEASSSSDCHLGQGGDHLTPVTEASTTLMAVTATGQGQSARALLRTVFNPLWFNLPPARRRHKGLRRPRPDDLMHPDTSRHWLQRSRRTVWPRTKQLRPTIASSPTTCSNGTAVSLVRQVLVSMLVSAVKC